MYINFLKTNLYVGDSLSCNEIGTNFEFTFVNDEYFYLSFINEDEEKMYVCLGNEEENENYKTGYNYIEPGNEENKLLFRMYENCIMYNQYILTTDIVGNLYLEPISLNFVSEFKEVNIYEKSENKFKKIRGRNIYVRKITSLSEYEILNYILLNDHSITVPILQITKHHLIMEHYGKILEFEDITPDIVLQFKILIEKLHKIGIIHFDLPNILIKNGVIKLIDFESSQFINSKTINKSIKDYCENNDISIDTVEEFLQYECDISNFFTV